MKRTLDRPQLVPRWLPLWLPGALLIACSASEAKPPRTPALASGMSSASVSAPRAPATNSPARGTSAAPSTSVLAPQPAAPTATPEPPAPPPFLPADFSPPFARSAAPEDGTWIPIGEAESSELAAAKPPRIFRASVHPHRSSPFKRMDVAAVDLGALSLHWSIGADDAGSDKLTPHMRPGLIDAALQPRAVAIFNGGFLARHGRWGQMSHGIEIVPPRDIGCTLTIAKAEPGAAGAVQIRPWAEVSAAEELRSFRQSAPCLLKNGEVHPNLVNGQARVWAGRNPKRKTRRRSAVGIDAARTTLFYAMGTETEAVDLARGMQAVGASHAMQLDINWYWTRFLLVGRQEGEPRVTSTLAKNMDHTKTEYFGKPSKRDFFYLVEVHAPAERR